MTEIPIIDWKDLLQHFGSAEAGIYRGVSHSTYDLLPKIGRNSSIVAAQTEESFLQLFRDNALPYIKNMPVNTWEWLEIGRASCRERV
jgi:hypothetical protein